MDLLTPFTIEGDVDFAALGEYLKFLSNAGVQTVLCNGEMGEFSSLTTEERMLLVQFVRGAFSGTVLNHVSASALPDVTRLISHSSSDMPMGGGRSVADAVLLMPPYSSFGSCTDEGGSEAFLRRALQGCWLPVFLYSAPGNPISPGLYARLCADFPTLSGILDGSGNADVSMELKKALPARQLLVCGDHRRVAATGEGGSFQSGDAFSAVKAGGADACVMGASNPLPELSVRMQACFDRGDTSGAGHAQRRLDVWARKREAVSAAQVPLVKAAVAARVPGFGHHVRPPYEDLGQEMTKSVMRWVSNNDDVRKERQNAHIREVSTQLSDVYRKAWNSVEVAGLEMLFKKLSASEDKLLSYLERARQQRAELNGRSFMNASVGEAETAKLLSNVMDARRQLEEDAQAGKGYSAGGVEKGASVDASRTPVPPVSGLQARFQEAKAVAERSEEHLSSLNGLADPPTAEVATDRQPYNDHSSTDQPADYDADNDDDYHASVGALLTPTSTAGVNADDNVVGEVNAGLDVVNGAVTPDHAVASTAATAAAVAAPAATAAAATAAAAAPAPTGKFKVELDEVGASPPSDKFEQWLPRPVPDSRYDGLRHGGGEAGGVAASEGLRVGVDARVEAGVVGAVWGAADAGGGGSAGGSEGRGTVNGFVDGRSEGGGSGTVNGFVEGSGTVNRFVGGSEQTGTVGGGSVDVSGGTGSERFAGTGQESASSSPNGGRFQDDGHYYSDFDDVAAAAVRSLGQEGTRVQEPAANGYLPEDGPGYVGGASAAAEGWPSIVAQERERDHQRQRRQTDAAGKLSHHGAAQNAAQFEPTPFPPQSPPKAAAAPTYLGDPTLLHNALKNNKNQNNNGQETSSFTPEPTPTIQQQQQQVEFRRGPTFSGQDDHTSATAATPSLSVTLGGRNVAPPEDNPSAASRARAAAAAASGTATTTKARPTEAATARASASAAAVGAGVGEQEERAYNGAGAGGVSAQQRPAIKSVFGRGDKAAAEGLGRSRGGGGGGAATLPAGSQSVKKPPLKKPRYGRYIPEGSPPKTPTTLPPEFPFQADVRSTPPHPRGTQGYGSSSSSSSRASNRGEDRVAAPQQTGDEAVWGRGGGGGVQQNGRGLDRNKEAGDGKRGQVTTDKFGGTVVNFREQEKETFFKSKGIEGDVDSFNWDELRRNTREIENLQKAAVQRYWKKQEANNGHDDRYAPR